MSVCHTCGNEYDKSFQVHHQGETYDFDSFECAIAALAPECSQCGCRIIGHGVEHDEEIFCCVHCAEESGVRGLSDRS